MSYELVSFTSIKTRLAEGWVPAPNLEPVYRYVSPTITQTYVWMMRPSDG